MMKTTLSCGMLLLAAAYFNAQTTGKVGINTNSPKETLEVNGTLKIDTLPTNGANNAIYNGQNAKNATFTATKTLVADNNGTIGVIDGIAKTTEPWQVVGGTTQATSNTDNIYQNGNVGIGSFGQGKSISNKLEVGGSTKLDGALNVTGNSTLDGTLSVKGQTTLGNALSASSSVGTAGQVLMSKGENSAPEWKSLKDATGVVSETELKLGTTEIEVNQGKEEDIPGLTYTITVPAGKEKLVIFNIVGYAAPNSFGGTQGVFELFQNDKKISSAYAAGFDSGDKYLRNLTGDPKRITTEYLALRMMNTAPLGKVPIPTTLIAQAKLTEGEYTFKVKYKSWYGTSKINVDASAAGYNGSTPKDNNNVGDSEALLSKMLISVYNTL